MDGQPAVYLGRIVPKANFRVFIHSPEGHKKLVNSWDEYEKHMETGLWFSTEDEAKVSLVKPVISEMVEKVETPKKRQRKSQKDEVKGEPQEELIVPEMTREDVVLNIKDDFLSEAKL